MCFFVGGIVGASLRCVGGLRVYGVSIERVRVGILGRFRVITVLVVFFWTCLCVAAFILSVFRDGYVVFTSAGVGEDGRYRGLVSVRCRFFNVEFKALDF